MPVATLTSDRRNPQVWQFSDCLSADFDPRWPVNQLYNSNRKSRHPRILSVLDSHSEEQSRHLRQCDVAHVEVATMIEVVKMIWALKWPWRISPNSQLIDRIDFDNFSNGSKLGQNVYLYMFCIYLLQISRITTLLECYPRPSSRQTFQDVSKGVRIGRARM